MMDEYVGYYSEWYSNLPLSEKAEVDAIADMYDEWDFIMECEL